MFKSAQGDGILKSKLFCLSSIFFCLFWFILDNSWAFSPKEDTELLLLEAAEIATGHPQRKFEAPSTVSVITQEEMKNMGARTLLDALVLIPGLEVGLAGEGIPIVSLRGLYTAESEKILFLLNGQPINSALTGGGTLFFADISVPDIERIEVIRGPGSVLYGANAFSGVINIILKQGGEDQISYRRGSYDTDEIFLGLDKYFDRSKIWLSLDYQDSNGARMPIKRDYFDKININTNLVRSHHTDEWYRRGEYGLGFKKGPLTVEGLYISRDHGGFYNLSGVASDNTKFSRDFLWGHISLNENRDHFETSLSLRGSYYRHNHYVDFFPPGTVLTFPNSNEQFSFPYGIRWKREAEVLNFTGETKVSWYSEKTRITAGLVLSNQNLYNVKFYENVLLCTEGLPSSACYQTLPYLQKTPTPYLQEIPEEHRWLKEANRFYNSLYLQGEWGPRSWLNITLGGRWDKYSDFGGNTSLRAGLVFNPYKNFYTKFLYGEAFRAPSFYELYLRMCPINPIHGNTSLKPEKMRAYEFTLGWENSSWQLGATFFHQEYEDMISLVPYSFGYIYDNLSKNAHTDGFEIEGKFVWGITRENYIILNYACQDTDGLDTPLEAYNLATFNLNYRLKPWLNLNFLSRYVGKRGYPKIGDYIISNFVLSIFQPRWDLSFAIYNIFDKKYTFPDVTSRYPDNYIRPGRTINVRFTWYF